MSTNTTEIPRLCDYFISDKTGFLLEQPLLELPSYFAEWNDVGRNLAQLLTEHTLRQVVDKMSLLDHNRLSGHRQYRLAYTILSFVGNGYIWQETNDPAKSLPAQLAVPWYSVSCHLGLRPGICQANSVLSNWKIVDPDRPLSMDNMQLICELPGGSQCHWFLLTTGQIEMDVVHALKSILAAKQCIVSGDVSGVAAALSNLRENIILLKKDAARMHEGLDSDVFYHTIRPFLTGWGGVNSVLPDGVLFQGVSDTPLQVAGGSAAQSSTIQCLDAALGITHDPDKQQFLNLMRTYMPPAHAQFISDLQKPPSIRHFASCCHDDAVVKGYDGCVQALVDFRSYHIQLTTKYIVAKAKSNAIGTGGTQFTPLLKSIRDTTRSAAVGLHSNSSSSSNNSNNNNSV